MIQIMVVVSCYCYLLFSFIFNTGFDNKNDSFYKEKKTIREKKINFKHTHTQKKRKGKFLKTINDSI